MGDQQHSGYIGLPPTPASWQATRAPKGTATASTCSRLRAVLPMAEGSIRLYNLPCSYPAVTRAGKA